MNADIAIVAIGYNRPGALRRLLESLSGAHYSQAVRLYISIDGGGGEEVLLVAQDFAWQYGEKSIIRHENNLGLREHVLRCGDLSQGHDALIALEDDLIVSPGFFDFALQSYGFYKNDPDIGGTSLYQHSYNETAQFPFIPLSDGSDVFFLKYASSWGQMWTKEQWKGFRSWYDARDPESKSYLQVLPPNIRLWPENSWKKYFIAFLNLHNRYFVYPRWSLTTVFGDEGTNIRIRETFLQVPLWQGGRDFIFNKFNDSVAVYDTWCEILPDRLKRRWDAMNGEDFGMDLYGMKSAEDIEFPRVISSRRCSVPEQRFGREMKPHEENLLHQVGGDHFHFGRKEDFSEPPYMTRLFKCHEKKELSYWYPIREYHFHRNNLLSTDKRPMSLANPVFLFRKLNATAKYAFRYFFRRK